MIAFLSSNKFFKFVHNINYQFCFLVKKSNFKMDKYLNPLIKKFKENKDAGIAVGQKKYIKSKFEFLGLKTPVRKEILKEHFKTYGKPEKTKINDYIKFL